METERNQETEPEILDEEIDEVQAPVAITAEPAEAVEATADAPADARPRPREGAADTRTAAGPDDRRRPRGRRRRVCIMCADKIKVVDYKNVSFLRRFVSDRARIETRRKSSACAKHQRALAAAIKRARHLALLPYTAEHIRGSGISHR
jgi:small subunit ribosomal protein S18